MNVKRARKIVKITFFILLNKNLNFFLFFFFFFLIIGSKFSLTSSSNEVLFEIDENSGNVVVKNTLSVAGVDLLNEINALKNRVAALEAAKPIQSFVNWGTQECPSNTKLLFAGNVMTPRGNYF